MIEGFKRFNTKNEILIQENIRLVKLLETFQSKYSLRTDSTTEKKNMSSPFLKMDETSVHSPLNAKNSTVSEHDTASSVQTVISIDLSKSEFFISFIESTTSIQVRKTLLVLSCITTYI
ncbi:hypothetical protein AABB24_023725 [Solanum stoloniferum]|uniref:Uncharacterized protein n=1 Tax=Solanum stoloniferum TaxID=62892 RepID=A0ABD2SKT7_9SOLN